MMTTTKEFLIYTVVLLVAGLIACGAVFLGYRIWGFPNALMSGVIGIAAGVVAVVAANVFMIWRIK